jgi:hypothetical protein
MLLVAHLPKREAVSPEMAGALVLAVERLRVDAVRVLERAREGVAEAGDDEVVVVRHQAQDEHVQAVTVHGARELLEEQPSVCAVSIDPTPCDSARRRVPDAVLGEARARDSRHLATVDGPQPVQGRCGRKGTELLRTTRPLRTPSGDCPPANRGKRRREWR